MKRPWALLAALAVPMLAIGAENPPAHTQENPPPWVREGLGVGSTNPQELSSTPKPQNKRSGYDDASPDVRAMQDDDTQNPAMLWVQGGQALWDSQCVSCHGKVESLRGVAARYPAYDAALSRPITLAGRINQCRVDRAGQTAWAPDSEAMLSVTALVGMQSRGMTVAVPGGGPGQVFLDRGRAFFELRQGQLNLSCAQCHDGLAGQRLGGSHIPQGQPNAYPEYRLEWQGMGSLDRRIRNCLNGVRAEPLAPDSADMVALQYFLGWRANGLKIETPGVRP